MYLPAGLPPLGIAIGSRMFSLPLRDSRNGRVAMRKLLTSTAVVLAALSGMSPALAQSSSYTLYTTIYYDTPSFDNQVASSVANAVVTDRVTP